MILKQLKPRKALNKAYLKLKPNRDEIDSFKKNLIQLLDRINKSETEEYHKNLITYFLRRTYYKDNHFINTKGWNDLVIHNGENSKSSVGVIVETKKPDNKWEMITPQSINAKAFHELLLYYLRERITNENLEIRNLIVTNIHEWYIFDANLFERVFAQNKQLVGRFKQFESGTLSGTKTEFFYNEIAQPFIETLSHDIEYTHFDIREYEKPLRNDNPDDDNKLIALFKLLSPEHLLKLPFANDSNTLDKRFYGELLYIMGLSETKQGGKKIIERNKEGERNIGSILENAVNELDSMDRISRLESPGQFGDNLQERLFNVALELSITWMNRVLFLKLLEAQLIKYHKDDTSYEFLNIAKINNYDDLNSLFFKVLARKLEDRGVTTKDAFQKVPYLNSSLFEPTELEHTTLFVSNLSTSRELPIYNATVLKDKQGKRKTGKLNALQYLFEFLDAYDFTSEGSEEIQEDNKTLINASVLGLIFEKINGYKDGSFFTPGFITMYMCRETIRKAVLQKFNEVKGWDCENMTQLYNKIEDTDEANQIVNSLKICDPAVGSGHFLVSALNEIIAIKNDLRILEDRDGRRLKEYHVEVENDELIVTDEDGAIFEYNPNNRESQRVQEALFHEKQTIIENCLFGVDINPNSVKICRLRLWIELLKNAYYKTELELETLPNIDINIKCGNSLVSRFPIDANLGQALKQSKWSIESYRSAVSTYRNAHNRDEKREMEQLMKTIKNDFRSEIADNDPKRIRLRKVRGQLFTLTNQTELFEQTKKEKREWNKKVERFAKEIDKLETEIEEIKNNKIYDNAFEWRFEFPEVLNENGDFVGFDVVIGNPPYISHDKIEFRDYLKLNFKSFEPFADLYCYFFELGVNVLNTTGYLNFITSNSFLKAEYGKPLRDFFNKNGQFVQLINIEDAQIFEDATVNTAIGNFSKGEFNLKSEIINQKYDIKDDFSSFIESNRFEYHYEDFNTKSWNLAKREQIALGRKLNNSGKTLEQLDVKIRLGIATGANKAFIIDDEVANKLIKADPRNKKIIKPVLRGRDISRYNYKQEKYILLTKNGVDVEHDYPVIFNYLDSFGDNFKNRGAKGKHWTNLRACSFFDDFKKTKIIWIELTDTNKFAICDEEIYLLNSAYFLLPPEELEVKFLAGLLNSKTIKFYLKLIANTSGVGTTRWINAYVKEFPIARSQIIEKQIIEIVDKVDKIKKQSPTADTTTLESQIDQLVYELYGLTEEEIGVVENSLNHD